MSIDSHRVILTGENPFIRLSESEGGPLGTNASFWRILFSPAGPGHVLYMKSELTEDRWHIWSDNIAMTRWLQATVQGMLNQDLSDATIPVSEARFSRQVDARDAWTERFEAYGETIDLSWYQMGEPLLVHTQPGPPPARPFGVCTVLIPALGARVTRNGVAARGRPFPTQRDGRPFSTSALAFSESWTAAQ